MDELFADIITRGELSYTLARNIRDMGWAAAWYAANTRAQFSDDARSDKEMLNDLANKISSGTRLVASVLYASISLFCAIIFIFLQ